MPQNVYEGLFLFDSNRYGRDPVGVSGQVAEMVRKGGGEMLVSRMWEERRLAYPVKGQRKGTYWLAYFKLESDQLTSLNREARLSESILRHLVLKVDARIVDALVAHAKAGPAEIAKARAAEAARLAASQVAVVVEEIPAIEEL